MLLARLEKALRSLHICELGKHRAEKGNQSKLSYRQLITMRACQLFKTLQVKPTLFAGLEHHGCVTLKIPAIRNMVSVVYGRGRRF